MLTRSSPASALDELHRAATEFTPNHGLNRKPAMNWVNSWSEMLQDLPPGAQGLHGDWDPTSCSFRCLQTNVESSGKTCM